MKWLRIRNSVKHKRDPEAFKICKAKLEELHASEALGICNLYYFDASSFTLTSNVPYAWQDERICLKCSRSEPIHVLGFMNKANDFMPYIFTGKVDSDVVIACIDDFADQIKKETVLVIDNAPTHTSNKFINCLEGWKAKGLTIYNLSKYSPELNLIEILWHQIKYYWLSFAAYENYESLNRELTKTLLEVGHDRVIHFK